MNRLSFLKCFPLLGLALLPRIKVLPEPVKIEIQKNPLPIDSRICFIEDNISYELVITDPDFIEYNGEYIPNYYKEYYQITGRATTVDLSPNKFKRLCAKGNLVDKKLFTKEKIEEEASFVFNKLVENFSTKATKHNECPVIV